MPALLRNRSFWSLTVTQFLGAFNDTAFRQFITLIAFSYLATDIAAWLDPPATGAADDTTAPFDSQPWIFGIFSLPFVVFALFSGLLADRFSKSRLIQTMKVAEVAVMLVGMGTLFLLTLGSEWFGVAVYTSLLCLFLMGTQSAFFSPPKYGSIPELVEAHELTRANSIIGMTTQAAILLGFVAGAEVLGYLMDNELEFYQGCVFFIVVAAVGTATSFGIRRLPAACPERSLRVNPMTLLWTESRHLARDRQLFLGVLGLAWWWLIASLAIQVLNAYGKYSLGHAEYAGTYLMFPLLIGVAVGNLTASKLSGEHVELGLVPLGALFMGLGFCSLFWLEPTNWNASIALGVTGFFGGIYFVPLLAFTQERPDPAEKGRAMGGVELYTFLFIFLSAAVYGVFTALDLEPQQMLLATGALTIVGAGVICSLTPQYLMRLVLWVLTHTCYRIKVLHAERIPRHGGALLVPNHVSFADPFLVGASLTRYVRFLMYRSFLEVPIIGRFTRMMKVIPVADTDPPRQLMQTLKAAADHAAEGNLVAIFAEGGITRNGNLLPFSKGLEKIARRAGVPIVPVHIDRMWGSIFSYKGGKFFFKRPVRFPYPVTVSFGEPLPADTPAGEVRFAVQELSAIALDARKQTGETLSTRFLNVCRRYPRRPAVLDEAGRVRSFRELLMGVLLFRKLLRQRLASETHVGVLLPPGAAGAMTNVALAIMGKVSVNLNYTAGREAMDSALEQCGARTVITVPRFLEKLEIPVDERHVDVESLLRDATGGQKLGALLAARWLPGFILRRMRGVPHDPDVDATVIFSSGSTGVPKGVCLTHHNILSNARAFIEVLDLRADDRVVGVLPFFHSFGYTTTLWCPLLGGLMALYHPNPLDAPAIEKLIHEHKGTMLFATPTFYQGYLRRFKPEAVASLRFCMAGAEKLKPALRRLWEERFGLDILEGYGCTELSPVATVNVPDVMDADIQQIGNRPGTIGQPVPGVAARIVDPDTFEQQPTNTSGLLLIKGPNVMRGYLNKPDLTAEVIRDGWYVTGDIATIADDGFITITDRLARFSKIGGEMVPHVKVEAEIQNALLELEACSTDEQLAGECGEVAVVSVPDDRKGERLVVLHTPLTFPLEQLIDRVRESELPRLWMPRPDNYLEVETIPKLGSGKLNLRAIKDIALERLGPRESNGEPSGEAARGDRE